MDTQDLDSGSVDLVETFTTSLDSIVPATPASEDEFDEESHEPCGTGFLFNDPYRAYRERRPTKTTNKAMSLTKVRSLNTISRLRRGSAAACHNCKIVLDAILSYSSGRMPLDNIERVEVIPGKEPIKIFYRPILGESESDNEPRLREAELELFQLEGQTSPITHNDTYKNSMPIPTRKLPSEDTSSDQALQTLYDWIETCVEHHGNCARRKVAQLPKRILEIEGSHICLRERVSTPAMYACLSHCWGPTGPTIRLDKTSFGRLRDGIIIDQLPKTFADAVHLCKRLAISFIWIDACCILQDDKDDWEEAAATMASIYEQAHLTIAATWASNSGSGLFAPDRELYKARKLRNCELYVREKPDMLPPNSRSKGFPLLTRAWVYQERLLSSRMVHFGKDQMYWQCSTLFMTESGSTFGEYHSLPDSKSDTFLRSNDNPVSRWHDMVVTYSGLKLTFENDRLPAIAAIVEREMHRRKDDTYIAGMWTSSLLTDLLWFTDNTKGNSSLPRLQTSVPTWSWPSSHDRISWHSGSIVPSLRLLDLSFTRVGPAHIGEVTSASITLEGHACTTWLSHVRRPEFMDISRMEMIPPTREGFGVIMSCYTYMDFDWTTGDRPVAIGDTFISMLMKICPGAYGSCFGLVLQEMADGSFKRMGTIQIQPEWAFIASGEKTCKLLSEFVEAHPIRQVRII